MMSMSLELSSQAEVAYLQGSKAERGLGSIAIFDWFLPCRVGLTPEAVNNQNQMMVRKQRG